MGVKIFGILNNEFRGYYSGQGFGGEVAPNFVSICSATRRQDSLRSLAIGSRAVGLDLIVLRKLCFDIVVDACNFLDNS